jgi:heme/copper-type cytochrome/quinol oxidase subunit 2
LLTASVIVIAALAVYTLNPLQNGNTHTSSIPTCTTYSTSFLIIANGQGFNDSIEHGVPQNYWPILCVHRGDNVTIRVENTGNEAHGFQIAHYYSGGISLAEGQTVTIFFVADQAGSFAIKCNILCSVHPWMLSGIVIIR